MKSQRCEILVWPFETGIPETMQRQIKSISHFPPSRLIFSSEKSFFELRF